MKQIKTCPFCGNEAGIRDVYGVIAWTEDCEPVTRRMFVCECKGEECWVSPVTDEFETKEDAIEAWNRRA